MQYHMVMGFFGLVNIMQLHNKIEEAGLNFFLSLCCVLITFICMIFFFLSFGVLNEKGVHFFPQLHLNTTNCVCQVHFLDNDLEVFILKFVQTSLPGRHTMILYCIIIQLQGLGA